MKRRTALLLLASVVAVALGAAAVGVVALLLRGGGGGGLGGGNRFLVLSLAGELPEQPPASELETFFERRPPSLRTLVDSLDRAGKDPKVRGVLLRVSMLPDAGWAKLQELRDAVLRFRRSGKPAYAHLEFGGNKEYYLATACDKIYAVPTALVGVNGLEIEATFLRETLGKIGIEAQFEAIGRYKSAPSRFTETGMTGPDREQLNALLDSLNGQFVEAIAKSRGKTPAQVQALIDDGPYDGRSAKAAGLVDELLYKDEIEAKLGDATRVSPGSYLRSLRGLSLDGRPKVALVYAVGEIMPGESQGGGVFGGEGVAGSDTVAEALRQARLDSSVKAILFRVNSPGGFGPAADVIWREVEVARRSKPVVVSMGDYAASGGYYVAMGADAIVAQPGTLTGSIGVFGGKFNMKGLYDKIGLTKEILTRGRHAALYSEYRPWSDEERARIRSQMEGFYRDFVSRAAKGRHRSVEEIESVAQGRVWTGSDARREGLVDALGGVDTALGMARKRAGIGADQDVTLVVYPARKGFFEALMERQQEETGAVEALPADLRATLGWLTRLSAGGTLARLPFELRIR